MKNKIIYTLIALALIVCGAFGYNYLNRPEKPTVGADGKISGEYSMQSIMTLGAPYKCTFERTDGTSKILGTMYTDGKQIYGEFQILTDAAKNNNFSSFLIIKEDKSYVWTSLQPLGYESKPAKSAWKGASVEEQAQIVGVMDKLPYQCEVWNNPDLSVFEIPNWVTFGKL